MSQDQPSKVELLSDEQAIAFFHKQTQALLQISGAEFLARAQRGEYKDASDNPKVLKLLMMIPESASGHEQK